MAIDQPGAIEPHPRRSRRAAAQRRTAGQTLFCLARGMPSAGVPAPAGRPGRGKKWRPPLRADDRGGAGPRRDSPIRGPRGAPGTSARRRGGNRLHDARGRNITRRKTCAGVSMAAMQERGYCRPGDRRCAERVRFGHELHSWLLAVERRLWADERRDFAWAETWGGTDRLAAHERRGARTVPEPKEAERLREMSGCTTGHAKTAYESARLSGGGDPAPPLFRNIPGQNCDRRLMIRRRGSSSRQSVVPAADGLSAPDDPGSPRDVCGAAPGASLALLSPCYKFSERSGRILRSRSHIPIAGWLTGRDPGRVSRVSPGHE